MTASRSSTNRIGASLKSHTQHNDGNLGLERRKLHQQHGKPSR
ncbi:hypothetical protein PF008_g8637, partial [Phytophthora fragariae]